MAQLYSRPALLLTGDREFKDSITKLLSTLQFRVDCASTSSEAYQLASSKEYLLIFASEEPSKTISAISFYKKLMTTNPEYKQKVLFFAELPNESLEKEFKYADCHYLNRPLEPASLAKEIEVMRENGIFNEARIGNRYNWTGECTISAEGTLCGKTMDISSKGIKMYYNGETVPANSEISISIPDIQYKGKAMVRWNFRMGEKNMMGLDLVEEINPLNLQKAIPFAYRAPDLA